MHNIEDLIDRDQPGIDVLREWVSQAEVACELLPPSEERERVLTGVQVTTHSTLGALAYDTGGLLVDHGWLRLLGSGHPKLPRTLVGWNDGRADGYYLVGDDAAGGFFAMNGGALGSEVTSIYYWAPDRLEWECLELGFTDFVHACLTGRLAAFCEGLRWPTWREDVAALTGDQCFSFYPPLWTKEGSAEGSLRRPVPVADAFRAQMDLARQLRGD